MCQFSVVRGSKEEPLWNEEELSKSCKQGCRNDNELRSWAESFQFRLLSEIAKGCATAPMIRFIAS